VKKGDLVNRCKAFGLVVRLSKNKKTAEVRWLNKHYLASLQYIKDLEVVSESR